MRIITMTRRKRREYTEDFKRQIVQLYKNGKPSSEIIGEYELTPSTFHKWVKQDVFSGSFKECDNLTPEQKEIIELKKRLKHAEMENDILKQAALIMGRK